MKLDLAIVGIVALFGILGIISGAVKQFSHWAGLALGYFASRPLASALAPWAAKSLAWPPVLLDVLLSCALFVLLSALGTIVTHFLFARLLRGHEDGPANRALGFVLGAGKAAAGIFVALSALLFFDKPLAQTAGTFDSQAKNSKAVAFVRSHNLFAALHLPALAGIQKMLAAQQDPRAAPALLNDPDVKALLGDPRLKAVLADPALRKALTSGDTAALLDSAKLKELLDDPALAEPLSRMQAR
jgi:membrane protein required for colicin V production